MALTSEQEEVLERMRIVGGWDTDSIEWHSLYALANDNWEGFQAIAREAIGQTEETFSPRVSVQLSFNMGNARDYLREMHELGQKRDEINAQMNDVRKLAREAGTPVKTLEKAIALENARRKEDIKYDELAQICEEAWGVVQSREDVQKSRRGAGKRWHLGSRSGSLRS